MEFRLQAPFEPAGDQPQAIRELVEGQPATRVMHHGCRNRQTCVPWRLVTGLVSRAAGSLVVVLESPDGLRVHWVQAFSPKHRPI